MLVACCHIPACRDHAGRRGFMCPTHWGMVPRDLQVRYAAAVRAWNEGKPGASLVTVYGAECIQAVLVELWTGVFPIPPGHTWTRGCGCPLCTQAREVAPKAYAARRYRDTRESDDATPAQAPA